MHLETDWRRDLKGRLKEAGAFERGLSFSIASIAAPTLLLGLSLALFTVLDSPWLLLANALLLAFTSIQLGFVMHDAGHGALFRAPLANDLAGLLAADLLTGLSYGWWTTNHNQHHAHPNAEGGDPDLAMIRTVFALSPAEVRDATPARRLLAAHQALLAPLLFTLQIFGLKYYGLRFLLTERSKWRGMELLLLALHHAAYFGFLIYVLGPVAGLSVALIHHMAAGFYLTAIVSPNHIARPMPERPYDDPVLRQVEPSRNIRTPPALEFLWGGLNHQIEHHLFPSIRRDRIHRALPVVRGFCAERGIAYHETSFAGCYREIFGLLAEVGASVRDGRPRGRPAQ
jgi:fatty acid desaturase